MANTLLDLYSGSIKLYDTVTHYTQDNVTYDIVTVVNVYNQLILYVVNRNTITLYKRITVPYISKCVNLVSTNYKFVSNTTVELIKVFGIFDDTNNHLTLFLNIYHSFQKTSFLFQLDIDNFNSKSPTITPVHNLLNTKHKILGVILKENMTYTDIKTISVKDVYIMTVNTGDSESIGGKNVEGVRVLLKDSEKDEFKLNNPSITFPETSNPVVDIWSEKRYRFYTLPTDASYINVSFSTGMAVIDLK